MDNECSDKAANFRGLTKIITFWQQTLEFAIFLQAKCGGPYQIKDRAGSSRSIRYSRIR